MALTYAQYVGDGLTRTFGVTFPYISKSHVKVRVNGTIVPFTWPSPSLVQLNSIPPTGAIIDVRRETPSTEALVDFHDGSTLVESDLDLSVIQSLYIAQELVDSLSLKLGVDTDGSVNANSRRIKNLGTPTQPTDAATQGYVDAAVAGVPAQVDVAKNYADFAAGRAQVASDKADVAIERAQFASTKADEAAASAVLAATFDPHDYFKQGVFRSDGTPNAPVLSGPNGELTAQRDAVVSAAAGQMSRLRFQEAGVAKWDFYRGADNKLYLKDAVSGNVVLFIDPVNDRASFTYTPLIGSNEVVVKDSQGRLPALDGSQLTGLPGLGVGQTPQLITGSRGLNVVYQNTTGKPIFVGISFTAANGSTGWASFFIGATSNPDVQIGSVGSTNGSTQNFFLCGIVPPGFYYKATSSGPAMVLWSELRT